MTWQRRNATLFEKEKAEIEERYPGLHFSEENILVIIRGSFPVLFEREALDHYTIEVQLAKNHPIDLPVVREIGGRIPHHPDRHVNANDGVACVLIPDERWKLWPVGAPLVRYFSGPLHSFFLAQTMVEEGEPWPFGQWEHGAKGIFQFYRELLGTSDLRRMINYLTVLSKESLKGHWLCPCESGMKLRDCHLEEIRLLREQIAPRHARTSLDMLRKAGHSAIETKEPKATDASSSL